MRRLSPARILFGMTAFCLATRGTGHSSFAGESTRYGLRAELGGEYDSNAHRAEIVSGAVNPPIVASPLARAAIGGQLSDLIAPGQQISVSATLAGKLFTTPAARSENVAVAQSRGLWRLALGDRTAMAAQALYYEAFQPAGGDPAAADERRDFRSLAPQLQIQRQLAPTVTLAAGLGYRWFVFKSDLDFDFQAPLGSIEVRWARESSETAADWELSAGGGAELRAFDSRALPSAVTTTSSTVPATAPLRRDTFLVGHVDLTRVGAALLGVGYALLRNQSNAYGETWTRHLLAARVSTPLPLDLYLAARAELVIASYRDPVVLAQQPAMGQLLSIDDENRSSLRVDLSRALSDRWLLLARYSFYLNELGTSASGGASGTASGIVSGSGQYRRQTALLSLVFSIDR